ncbi:MAG: 50S ribosomal protein L23 [Planctomycetaceae bacterium]|jgi:large subunit ribosomal protein L23|nr:50S ribosomal protein L23 [Planctomycetaceae bacterium]MDC0274218.1 50S ribosomal protein L23 [Planctomycetaceae bacterium]MDG2390599.1 50S ribosomal protein L23 [Planctomycetaceae bacterium]
MAVNRQHGVQLEAYQVVLRPLVTEKGTHLSEKYNSYTFRVHPLASKEDIRRAVQELWDVRVVKVRTQTRKGKPRRHKMAFGYTKDWKKAIVTLHDDDRISFF